MNRGSGPRRNPGKARAWQERSRQRAIERAERATPPELEPGSATGKSYRRGQSRRTVEFRPAVSARRFPCERCARLAAEAVAAGKRPRRISDAAHWHHWLEQQHLATVVQAMRLRDDRAEFRELHRLIHDERNLAPLCLACHGNTTTTHGAALTFADVPPAAFAFAAELGAEWLERLRRTYAGHGS